MYIWRSAVAPWITLSNNLLCGGGGRGGEKAERTHLSWCLSKLATKKKKHIKLINMNSINAGVLTFKRDNNLFWYHCRMFPLIGLKTSLTLKWFYIYCHNQLFFVCGKFNSFNGDCLFSYQFWLYLRLNSPLNWTAKHTLAVESCRN